MYTLLKFQDSLFPYISGQVVVSDIFWQTAKKEFIRINPNTFEMDFHNKTIDYSSGEDFTNHISEQRITIEEAKTLNKFFGDSSMLMDDEFCCLACNGWNFFSQIIYSIEESPKWNQIKELVNQSHEIGFDL